MKAKLFALASLVVMGGTLTAGPLCGRVSSSCGVQYQTTYYPTTIYQTQAYNYGYTQTVPYAIPYLYVPDTMYRVDSATAYARIAEVAAQSATAKSSEQMMAMFQEFLRQQQAMFDQARNPNQPPQPPVIPPAGPPPSNPPPVTSKGPNPNPGKPSDMVKLMAQTSCVSCHNPQNPKRLNLTDVTKLTHEQLLEVQNRIMSSIPEVQMPPATTKLPRPTQDHLDAVHLMVNGAK